MSTIGIIGAGQVGATLAFLVLERRLGDVVLVDILEGLAKGKALDMGQAGSLLAFKQTVIGTHDYSGLKGAEIVVITAGLPRKPGMTRLDLLKKNSEIVTSVIDEIVHYAPGSIIIVVTNPLDVMTYLALKKSGFEPYRVMGQAGVLDSARFKYFIAKESGCSPEEVSTLVLGGHGDSMVPLISQTTVSGRPLGDVLPKQEIDKLVERTCSGGAEIVSLLKTGSAYYAPASSVLAMIDAIINNTGEMLPCSVYLDGEYGLEDVCVGVPVLLGKEGVRKVVELDLTPGEKQMLHRSAETYRKSIKEVYSP